MNSSEFDRRFDEGESVLQALDLGGARRRRLEQKKVNVDFPLWMIEALDQEASRLGVTRQSGRGDPDRRAIGRWGTS